MTYWGAQLFGKRYRIEREEVTLAAAHTAHGVGEHTDRLVQGRRYEQWIASAPVKRWNVGSNLSRLPVLPQWFG
jgi:catalase